MDLSAVDPCRQHAVPIVVFDFFKLGNMRSVVLGAKVGTRIDETDGPRRPPAPRPRAAGASL